MGVEEPNLADPSVYSGESFSHWVINLNRALSTQERAPASRKQSRCTRRKDFAQSVFALAALSAQGCGVSVIIPVVSGDIFSLLVNALVRNVSPLHTSNSSLLSRGLQSLHSTHTELDHI